MRQEQAINLAFIIGEHVRVTKLIQSVEKSYDVTLTTKEVLQLQCNEGGLMTYPEIPHLLVRNMHESGSLLSAAKRYKEELDRALLDGFGVIIEENDK